MSFTMLNTKINPGLIIVTFIVLFNLWMPETYASERNTVFQNIKTLQYDRSIFGENNQFGNGSTSWSHAYKVNGFFDQEVESTYYRSNREHSISGFGFGDTELSAEFALVEESIYTPRIVTEITALVPVDFNNQGAVLKFQELEHMVGLKKEFNYIALKSKVGQITHYDQISGEGFAHYFGYALEAEFQSWIEGISYGLELSGDILSDQDENMETWVGFEPLRDIPIEMGLEMIVTANEMTPEAIQISLKWPSKM